MANMESDAAHTAARPKSRRRWYQFGLRTLLIAVTLAGCGLGWLGWKVREARQQAAIVAAIKTLGCDVRYDYEVDATRSQPGPAWLHSLLGDDFFRNVAGIYYLTASKRGRPVADADMELFRGLTQLKELCLDGTQVTDAGVARLDGLPRLESLDLRETQVTDAGLEHLKEFPRLKYLYVDGEQITDAGMQRLRRVHTTRGVVARRHGSD